MALAAEADAALLRSDRAGAQAQPKKEAPHPRTAALWPWPSRALAELRGPVSAKGGRVSPDIHIYYTTSQRKGKIHTLRDTHTAHTMRYTINYPSSPKHKHHVTRTS